jgi:CheY-like chemotaxis protein
MSSRDARRSAHARRRTISGSSDGDESDAGRLRLRGLSILVVDDQPYIRDLLHIRLEAEGASVETAGSAQQALEILETFRPALVLTDIHMSGEDGVWLLHRLRELRPDMAVIAVSGFFDPNSARLTGFDAFVEKPFVFDDLCTTILTARAARGRLNL